MKTNLLYTIIFLFSIFSLSTNAADVVVNGSGLSGTYTTISAGINAANPGDRILVSNQSFPYQEDTIFIDKDVTIIPYNDVTHILYEGHIKITLDSISNLTLIGFNSENTDIYSVFNDTSRNSLTTVNIIDCSFNNVFLNKVKTSTYLSHSTVMNLYFAHGDLIASKIIDYAVLGIVDFSYSNSYFLQNPNSSQYSDLDQMLTFTTYFSGANNYIGNNGWPYWPSECELFSKNVFFGNVSTYSDTCNIIANSFQYFINYTKDFPINLRNNNINYFNVLLFANTNKGTNDIINNGFSHTYFHASFCPSPDKFNFRDITVRYLNNVRNIEIYNPSYNSGASYSQANLNITKNSISSYNTYDYVSCNCQNPYYYPEDIFSIGPNNGQNNKQNPSSEFLNLDLTLNSIGVDGGSYTKDNIIGNQNTDPGFGSLSGSKARITYLNLPTQIFDPSNIRIKAKAVHGN